MSPHTAIFPRQPNSMTFWQSAWVILDVPQRRPTMSVYFRRGTTGSGHGGCAGADYGIRRHGEMPEPAIRGRGRHASTLKLVVLVHLDRQRDARLRISAESR